MLNTQTILRSCYIPYRSIEPTEEIRNAEEIKINFNDGTSAIYLMSDLIKLKGIKAILNSTSESEGLQPSSKEFREREITLKESSPEMFAVARTLILEQEPFYEVFSEESFDDPFFFEEISKLLLYFHLEDGQAIINEILKNQLPFMPYEIAKRTLTAYEEQISKHPEQFKNAETEPATVKVAKQIIFESQFLNESERSDHFNRLREYQQEKIACWKQSIAIAAANSKNEVEKSLTNSQLKQYENTIIYCDKNLALLRRRTDVKNLAMISRQNLLQRTNDPDQKIAELAQSSLSILENYKKSVIEGLERCKADMTRKDLLEYLVGPKAYLLDEYGFEVDQRPSFPTSAFFLQQVSRYGYSYHLASDNARQLENEIREDIITGTTDTILPDHIIKDKIVTKPITPEVVKLTETLLPVLQNWSSATEEQKKSVLITLLEYNGWNKLEIEYSDLTLENTDSKENAVIKGKLVKFGNTFPVHFKLNDFALLIPNNAKHKHPNKISTAKLLQEARNNPFYRWGEEQQRRLWFRNYGL